jgi:C-terminal processing protease CtpA/Prc
MKFLIALLFAFTPVSYISAQGVTLTPEMQEEIIESINAVLIKKYLFPEVAEKMKDNLLKNLTARKYDSLTAPGAFAEALTKDLYEHSKDIHVNLSFSPKYAGELERLMKDEAYRKEFEEKEEASLRKFNFYFKEIKRLNENIGYVKFDRFPALKYSKDVIIHTMGFLANMDAIIIDLRENGGGQPETVQYMCSYFFDSKPRLLNSLYSREKDETVDYYTLKNIEGKRMPGVPLFILTGAHTFSGAEEFAYNMQTQKRALIIGETTGGGAHDNEFVPVTNGFVLSVSISRAINPITKTNWEGTGVKPDIEVSPDKAYNTAYYEASKKLSDIVTLPEQRQILKWRAESLYRILNPLDDSGFDYASYPGDYGNRVITFENGTLYYQRKGGLKRKALPYARDEFQIEGVDYFTIRFEKDSEGKTTALIGVYSNGETDRSEKVN